MYFVLNGLFYGSRYHAGPSLLSLFDQHCSSVSDGIELQNFQNFCRDIELVPAPLTYTQVCGVGLRRGQFCDVVLNTHFLCNQVRSQFRLICAANEAEGTGGITLTYTGLVSRI